MTGDRQAPPLPLAADALCPRCEPAALGFALSSEVDPLDGLVGQERAVEAIAFGTAVAHDGFNIFVLGPEGSGRHTAVMRLAARQAEEALVPDDWVYVHNFATGWKPRAIRLPPGTALPLRDALAGMMADLRTAIPALFESDEYKERRRKIDETAEEEQREAFQALQEKANARDIGLVRTPMGFALAPIRNGKIVKPEEFNARPEADRKAVQETIEELQEDLAATVRRFPEIEKHRREQIRKLNAEMAATVVDSAIAAVRTRFAGILPVEDRLSEIGSDLLERVEMFVRDGGREEGLFPEASAPVDADPRFRRYLANPVVTNGGTGKAAAPVVYEDHPTLAHLVGRVEHIARMGALETDFLMIRPGALHRANGGFLVLDALKLLREPWAWEALKRALRSRTITVTSVAEELSLMSTVSLEPEPIPLGLKVVLIGEPLLYYLLSHLDRDFEALFKVQADFDEEVPRTVDNLPLYARLIATLADRHGLKPLDAAGTAAVIDEAARLAGDAERLSLRLGQLTDLMREADHRAGGADRITADNVVSAIEARTRRADRLREKSHEAITRGIRLIDTDGTETGQVNGLSVLQLGHFAFGQPSRITARVRMGTGKLVDIERETKLGGPIHSKGVLILTSYLAATYALDRPMSLWASLVFEQSYGGVEGDSASSAELYALISALADVPIRQSLAVTGSVNQLGEVQAIGGVNEKIEGFFDICARRGLTGEQGVLIPHASITSLVLRPRVVEAVRKGRFAVYPVKTIDQGIALLTGVPAGRRGADGRYPAGTVNGLAEARLQGFAEARRAFAAKEEDGGGDRE